MRVNRIHHNSGCTNKHDRLKFSETRTTVAIQCILNLTALAGYFGLLACDKSHFRFYQAYRWLFHFSHQCVIRHGCEEGNTDPRWGSTLCGSLFLPTICGDNVHDHQDKCYLCLCNIQNDFKVSRGRAVPAKAI